MRQFSNWNNLLPDTLNETLCHPCQGYWDISWESFKHHEQHQFLRCYDEAGWLLRHRPTPLSELEISGHLIRLWALPAAPPSPPPPPRSSAEVCNFTLQRQTAGQEENVWPTLAFVLISLSNVQTLLPLGYLKWCGEDSQPLLSSPR